MEQNRDNLSSLLLALFILVISIPHTTQLQSSQSWSFLRLQRLLNYPSHDTKLSSSLNNYTDVCYGDPSPSLTVVCYEESITQLQIVGQQGSPQLPKSFSIDSFFTTLTRLPDLKVLTLSSLGIWGPLPAKIWRLSKLEILNMSSNYLSGSIPQQISYLKSLQTLILDHNMFTGVVPDWLSAFPLLTVLSLRNNSLNGSLPNSIMTMDNLRVLSLSSNNMSGNLPDLSTLTNLQALDLENNNFGPQFPALQRKIAVIVLRKNKFTGALPQEVSSYYLLHHMDVSFNRFVSPFPSSLLNLPSIRYLNVAGNRFTGMLFKNMSCNEGLEFVDLSLNLLTGSLPTCLATSSSNKNVSYAMNCLATKDQSQHPLQFCQNEALAVGVTPHNQKSTSDDKVVLVTSVIGGVLAGVMLLGFMMLFGVSRANMRKAAKRPPRRLVVHASNGYPSKMLSDARYISQTMKLGALGIPPYRSFSLEEIEAATNNFESSALMGESLTAQMYKGKLKDGYQIAIKCLKLKRSESTQNFIRHIELIAKLRHRHLVSALGHCLEYHLEDSTIRRLFLIFEYVPNGSTMRSQVSGEAGTKITWNQRISAAIGVAKGIQFLHAGIIPGLFANGLRSTNVLVDQNFVAKISSYNLPLLTMEDTKSQVNGAKQHNRRENQDDKIDVHDFGVILLEIITGKPISTPYEIEMVADQLRLSISADDGTGRKRSIIDPAVARTCSNESLRTVIEICIGCVSKEPAERPSVEDVLWNLQFAAQVQEDPWRGNSRSSDGSLSPSSQQNLPQTFVQV